MKNSRGMILEFHGQSEQCIKAMKRKNKIEIDQKMNLEIK